MRITIDKQHNTAYLCIQKTNSHCSTVFHNIWHIHTQHCTRKHLTVYRTAIRALHLHDTCSRNTVTVSYWVEPAYVSTLANVFILRIHASTTHMQTHPHTHLHTHMSRTHTLTHTDNLSCNASLYTYMSNFIALARSARFARLFSAILVKTFKRLKPYLGYSKMLTFC